MRQKTLSYFLAFCLLTACNTAPSPTPSAQVQATSPTSPTTPPNSANTVNTANASTIVAQPTIINTPALIVPAKPAVAGAHPRLWLTADDVARLRTWATDANPMYRDGLKVAAQRAVAAMDAKHVPNEDCGFIGYNEYVTENYAHMFAFMSLVDPDAAKRADYAVRARTLLMHVMNAAAQGPATQQNFTCAGDTSTKYYPPFRHPNFFTEDADRPRYHGEAFPLIVDWIYPSLNAADKATIAKVFTRWGDEIIKRGYHHPEPIGVTRNTILTENREQVRWAGNNYFAAHMRNLGMLSMALDPTDSTPALQGYLANATGAWLFLFDHLIRTDSKGGLLPEGFEYSPQTASYAIQFLWALHTAGEADTAKHGAHVVLRDNPFWDDFVKAYFHSISPAPKNTDEGPQYQPSFYGDSQRYHLSDFIDAMGALAAYDRATANASRIEAVRWLQTHTAPGGQARLLNRVSNPETFRQAILYFMLFDPTQSAAADPRPALPLNYFAPGMNKLFSRSNWGTDAAWFHYNLSWNKIDHQHADGNHFEYYRKGEWLTKARIGYANIGEGIASSEFRNTLALQNAKPAERSDDDWRIDLWKRGSQWNLVSTGDPTLMAHSTHADYVYASGDATHLYNAEREKSTEIAHASRDIVWLKPDHIVVFDRADSPATRFKRWWLQLPSVPSISGNIAKASTASGQQLHVQSLLPVGAKLRSDNGRSELIDNTTAADEMMKERLMVEAPAADKVRFLHVLQGADKGVAADVATLVRSGAGNAYVGAQVGTALVMFPQEARQAFANTQYDAPAGVKIHLVTGLMPNTSYDVKFEGDRVSITSGAAFKSDSGGVLLVIR
jgi:hypothetical protein